MVGGALPQVVNWGGSKTRCHCPGVAAQNWSGLGWWRLEGTVRKRGGLGRAGVHCGCGAGDRGCTGCQQGRAPHLAPGSAVTRRLPPVAPDRDRGSAANRRR